MYSSFVDVLVRHGLGWLVIAVPSPDAPYVWAVIGMTALFARRGRALGVATDEMLEAVAAITVGALLGSRLFYLGASGGLWSLPAEKWFSLQGTASWGVYLGAAGAAALYARIRGRPPSALLDLLASVAGLGIVIGRCSCLLVGDDFGTVAQVPWAILFPPGTPAYQAHLVAGLIGTGAQASRPVHPLQVYLMLHGMLVLAICTYAWRRWRHVSYRTLSVFLIANGLSRVPFEFFRDAAAGGARDGISPSQLMCAVSVVLGVGLLIGVGGGFRHQRVAMS